MIITIIVIVIVEYLFNYKFINYVPISNFYLKRTFKDIL